MLFGCYPAARPPHGRLSSVEWSGGGVGRGGRVCKRASKASKVCRSEGGQKQEEEAERGQKESQPAEKEADQEANQNFKEALKLTEITI